MHKSIATSAAAVTVLLPTAQALAAPAASNPKKSVTTATKSFTGPAAQADQWGPLQVTIVVKKTTTKVAGKKATVKRRITNVTVPVSPNHTDRSVYINQQALPLLIQETLQAQSARIYLISGATYSSDAFDQSLQAAILAARTW